MYSYKLLLIAFLSTFLAACGGSSSSTTDTVKIVDLDADNIAKAITIAGAEPVSIDLDDSPQGAPLTNTDSVIVSANSSFQLQLFVPDEDIPEDMQVAGYVITLPDSSQHFVPLKNNAASAARALTITTPITKQLEKNGAVATPIVNSKQKQPSQVRVAQPIRAQTIATSGHATVVINGWSSANFNLDRTLSNLMLRIYPLFVNTNVADVADKTFAQLQRLGVRAGSFQELTLVAEAVATSPVQITLTWDTPTDVDLYVLEPGYQYQIYDDEYEESFASDEDQFPSKYKSIAYYNRISKQSLGWLDIDNTWEYGPENITFGFKIPNGQYHVAVNFYSGSYQEADTNYSVTIAIGNTVRTIHGKFAKDAFNYGDMSDLLKDDGSHNKNETNAGSDIVYSFTQADVNALLANKLPNSTYAGIYELPPESSLSGFVQIKADQILFHSVETFEDMSWCWTDSLDMNYLPTGFRFNRGLQVSDAFFGASYGYESSYSYAYRNLTRVTEERLTNALATCIYDEDDDDHEYDPQAL